jgi:hypothetical protein
MLCYSSRALITGLWKNWYKVQTLNPPCVATCDCPEQKQGHRPGRQRTIPLPLQGILETMLRHKMDPELRQAAVRQKQAMKNVKL